MMQNNITKLALSAATLYSRLMVNVGEIDEIWLKMLDDAAARAEFAGQPDIAEYFRLRAANDAVRKAGTDWLIDAVIYIGSDKQQYANDIKIERIDAHLFKFGRSTMVGTAIDIRRGVRCLTVEAGWARRPNDGIMRNGALAHAVVRHFGLPRLTAELSLRHADPMPNWFHSSKAPFTLDDLFHHFELLLS